MPLLAERARIGRIDLDDFEALHDRARRHRRSAVMRETHRTRRQTGRQVPRAEDTKGRAARTRGGRRGGVPRTARLVRVRPAANRRGPCRGARRGGVGSARGPGTTGPGASEAGLVVRLGASGRRVERADRSCPTVGHDRILHEGLCRADPAHPGTGGEDGPPGWEAGAAGAGAGEPRAPLRRAQADRGVPRCHQAAREPAYRSRRGGGRARRRGHAGARLWQVERDGRPPPAGGQGDPRRPRHLRPPPRQHPRQPQARGDGALRPRRDHLRGRPGVCGGRTGSA